MCCNIKLSYDAIVFHMSHVLTFNSECMRDIGKYSQALIFIICFELNVYHYYHTRKKYLKLFGFCFRLPNHFI